MATGTDAPPDLRPAARRIASILAEDERAEAEELLLTETLPAEYAARIAEGDAPEVAWRLAEEGLATRLRSESPLARLVILRDLRYLADYRTMQARASVLSHARYAKERPLDFARRGEPRPFGLDQALELSVLDIAREATVLAVRYQLWLLVVQTPEHFGAWVETMRSVPGTGDLSAIIEYARTGHLVGYACQSPVARWLGRPPCGRLILR
ncbi:MAG: hypothetical protein IT370_30205 [Deltaproteobacteria bacterium]|nr:hypothetical protein [Deltaproteobacteria bacterium]